MQVPSGFTSVMAMRAPTNPDDLDYFPTPPWAARAGAELIQRLDPGATSCWEPACGGGHMAWGLKDHFRHVFLSDVHDYGTPDQAVVDFLNDEADAMIDGCPAPDWIVTNPPFVRGDAFVRAAWNRAGRGVAMLLRLAFLEGGARYRLFADCPLSVLAPFSERVPMVKGRWDPEASSATAYAWFIWLKGDALPEPRVWFIPPGTRARLSQPDDLIQFGHQADAPLLGSAA